MDTVSVTFESGLVVAVEADAVTIRVAQRLRIVPCPDPVDCGFVHRKPVGRPYLVVRGRNSSDIRWVAG